MRQRAPMQAYRLRYEDSPHTPETLWEWEEPYISHLRWNAKTFGRTLVHCTFLRWHALDAANQRIWETSYLPRSLFESWENWQAWLAEYGGFCPSLQKGILRQYATAQLFDVSIFIRRFENPIKRHEMRHGNPRVSEGSRAYADSDVALSRLLLSSCHRLIPGLYLFGGMGEKPHVGLTLVDV
jgi:hypothetical protein